MGRKGQSAHNKVEVDDVELRRLYVGGGQAVKAIAQTWKIGVGPLYRRLRELGLIRTNSEAHIGIRPSNFRGWYIEQRTGYKMVLLEPNSPFIAMGIKAAGSSSLYVREHRLVMAQHLGRPLERWEVVHHKNHHKLDNRIENLELIQGQTCHQGETIAHTELLKMKAEMTRLKAENGELKSKLKICRAALKAAGVE